jgi:hypothetical protein
MAKGKRRKGSRCRFGTNMRTGKCLKRPRRKKSLKRRKKSDLYVCMVSTDSRGKRRSKCGSGKSAFKVFTTATKELHKGKSVELRQRRVAK